MSSDGVRQIYRCISRCMCWNNNNKTKKKQEDYYYSYYFYCLGFCNVVSLWLQECRFEPEFQRVQLWRVVEWQSSGGRGMTVAGKIPAVPKPFNLLSQLVW